MRLQQTCQRLTMEAMSDDVWILIFNSIDKIYSIQSFVATCKRARTLGLGRDLLKLEGHYAKHYCKDIHNKHLMNCITYSEYLTHKMMIQIPYDVLIESTIPQISKGQYVNCSSYLYSELKSMILLLELQSEMYISNESEDAFSDAWHDVWFRTRLHPYSLMAFTQQTCFGRLREYCVLINDNVSINCTHTIDYVLPLSDTLSALYEQISCSKCRKQISDADYAFHFVLQTLSYTLHSCKRQKVIKHINRTISRHLLSLLSHHILSTTHYDVLNMWASMQRMRKRDYTVLYSFFCLRILVSTIEINTILTTETCKHVQEACDHIITFNGRKAKHAKELMLLIRHSLVVQPHK